MREDLAPQPRSPGDLQPLPRDVKDRMDITGARWGLDGAEVVGAVGAEDDLLVGLHALGGEQLEEAPLGLGVVGLDEPETFGRATEARPAGERARRGAARTAARRIADRARVHPAAEPSRGPNWSGPEPAGGGQSYSAPETSGRGLER